MTYTAKQLSEIFEGATFTGNLDSQINSIASLSEAKECDLSFLGNIKYSSEVALTKASILILPNSYKGDTPATASVFRCENPSILLAKFCAVLEKQMWPEPKRGFIHPSAVVEDSAQVDSTANIGPFCYIGRNAKIGKNSYIESHNHIGANVVIKDNCHLMPRAVVMDYCVLGSFVRLQPGCVIGSDGYGYEYSNGVHHKVPQIGNVVVEDYVEIGANTCIDRARFDKTLIGAGSKLDNLVQIAHNVKVGKLCLIVSQTGISGSTTLGNGCILGGQVGLVGHITLGDGAKVGAQSGVNCDVPSNLYIQGTPALPYMLHSKLDILHEKLPDFFSRLKDIEKHLGIEKKTFGTPRTSTARSGK